MYRLGDNLPQANMLNPAFFPNHRVVIGLPVISGIYLNVNNDGIAFNDIFFRNASDSLQLDTLGLPDKFRSSHRFRLNEQVQLFYFGLRTKRSYLSFGIHQVSESRFSFPGKLVSWAIRGPADLRNAGNSFDFSDFYSRGFAYNQVSVSYAREIIPNLRIGARFKYLLGIVSGETTQTEGTLTVGIDSVSIQTGDLIMQTGGIDFFDQSNLTASDYVNYFLKGKNNGMAVDLGAVYQINNHLSVSAAINDLGSITWKDYTRTYQIDAINYTYRGFDLLDYFNNSNQQFLSQETDSLENLFNATETPGGQFTTSLIGKFYAGVNYRLLKVNNFSAQFYFDLFREEFNPAVSVGYTLQLGRLLSATIGATYQDRKIDNVGGGIVLKLGPNQIYATSDRVNSFYYPARASRGDAHLGMNLVFGKLKKDKKEEEVEEEEPEEVVPLKVDSVTQEKPDSVEVEPVDSVETETDTVEADPVQARPEEVVPQEDTVSAESPVIEDTVITRPVVQSTITAPDHETYRRGNHPDELLLGHFVIVGAFSFKDNAEAYVRLLGREGYRCDFGFLTEKLLYYVYTFRSAGDMEAARAERDRLRAINKFQFPESWVLSVER